MPSGAPGGSPTTGPELTTACGADNGCEVGCGSGVEGSGAGCGIDGPAIGVGGTGAAWGGGGAGIACCCAATGAGTGAATGGGAAVGGPIGGFVGRPWCGSPAAALCPAGEMRESFEAGSLDGIAPSCDGEGPPRLPAISIRMTKSPM